MSEQTLIKDTQDTVLNGVNVTQLFEVIDVINDNADVAHIELRASNNWIDGAYNRSKINGFYAALEEHSREKDFVMDNDEPPVLLGTDKSANPAEYILHALAGCISTTLVYHAAAKGIKVEKVETRFEGDIDLRGFLGLPGYNKVGYEEIRVYINVIADASKKEIEELVELAQRRSVVFNTLRNPVPINVKIDN